jgi:uncharacterized protein YeeX (DUF496 family)
MQSYDELLEDNRKLQRDLNNELAYTREINNKRNRLESKNRELQSLLNNSIPKTEHEKILNSLREDYERRMTEIKMRSARVHNERGAGRKRVASKETINVINKLYGKGLSQAKIASLLAEEHGIKISRTVVGEIIRGEYIQFDKE